MTISKDIDYKFAIEYLRGFQEYYLSRKRLSRKEIVNIFRGEKNDNN